jgi:ribonuclease G
MKKILMNIQPWQTRIAVTRDSHLQNIYFSAHAKTVLERSFFKGVVTKVLPGMQTAFVDIGQERAGFLHISEVDRELAIERMSAGVDLDEEGEAPKPKRVENVDIKKIFQEGESILVQVSKEPVYEKGAKLSTCFTLPGRFVVLMPNIPRIAISKKIEDRDERTRLKTILSENLPEGMGAIIRTTSEGRSEKEIIRDLKYLLQTWNDVLKNYEAAKPKEKVHEDLPLVLQIVRDQLDEDVEALITDDPQTHKEVLRFVKSIAPEYAQSIKLYTGPQPLFERYEIEKQIDGALLEKVELKSGGSIIIETTQAMTVIDVNTGRYIGKGDLEETILQTNMEAAEEIVWQLKLRNIGGLIVIDFIDMGIYANRQKLFKFFERMLKEQDRLQSVLLRVSEFGLVQMTRKRSGKTLQQELTHACACCKGLGYMKSIQTESYAVLNKLKAQIAANKITTDVSVTVNPKVFEYISNVEYNTVLHLEKLLKHTITLVSDEELLMKDYVVE